jgi:hypothetical protein
VDANALPAFARICAEVAGLVSGSLRFRRKWISFWPAVVNDSVVAEGDRVIRDSSGTPARTEPRHQGCVLLAPLKACRRLGCALPGRNRLTCRCPHDVCDAVKHLRLPLASAAVAAVVGACVVLGQQADMYDSDSLIPILNSLYYWTPFYWEQNRFGMLVPLLFAPVRNPWLNLLGQNWIDAACGIGLFFVVPRLLLPDDDDSWYAVGLLSAISLLVLTSSVYRFSSLSSVQPYSVSLFLGVSSCLIWTAGAGRASKRVARALAVGASLCAAWVSAVAPLFVLLLLLGRFYLSPRRFSSWRIAIRDADVQCGVMTGVAFLVGDLLMQLPSYRPTKAAAVRISNWAGGFAQLWANSWSVMAPPQGVILPAAVIVSASALVLWLRRTATNRVYTRAVPALLGAGFIYVGVVGSLKWTAANQYAFRYAIPGVVLVISAACLNVIAVGTARLGERPKVVFSAVLTGAVVLASVTVYGWPSFANARRAVDGSLGRLSHDLIAARCTHVVGDYWAVWPRVYHANLVHHELQDGQRTWGITFRSSSTQSVWRALPLEQWRVCASVGEEAERDRSWKANGIPPATSSTRVGNLDVFTFD